MIIFDTALRDKGYCPESVDFFFLYIYGLAFQGSDLKTSLAEVMRGGHLYMKTFRSIEAVCSGSMSLLCEGRLSTNLMPHILSLVECVCAAFMLSFVLKHRIHICSGIFKAVNWKMFNKTRTTEKKSRIKTRRKFLRH